LDQSQEAAAGDKKGETPSSVKSPIGIYPAVAGIVAAYLVVTIRKSRRKI
jgi:hypothetical protein